MLPYCPLLSTHKLTTQEQVKHVSLVPSERSAIVFAFVITVSVGLAVSILFFWHLYLVFTAQTTIEFYQNQNRRARARARGEVWTNPFDLGTDSKLLTAI
jgi:hypothetical protein